MRQIDVSYRLDLTYIELTGISSIDIQKFCKTLLIVTFPGNIPVDPKLEYQRPQILVSELLVLCCHLFKLTVDQ